jgi:hypothetical protein
MKASVLNGKIILAVDEQLEFLTTLEQKILSACPTCQIDKAATYQEATQKLESKNYDLVILVIMGGRGFDLLDLPVKRNLRVAMLTAHALNPEALKQYFKMKAQTCLPKENLGGIVPFLEDVLTYGYLPGWKHIFKKLKVFFKEKFEDLKELIDEMSLYPERCL